MSIGFANRRKPALSIHPPCVSTVEMWFDGLNLYCMYSLEYGTRRFYLYSLAEYRSLNSALLIIYLLIPSLLRLGSVGVLTSVPSSVPMTHSMFVACLFALHLLCTCYNTHQSHATTYSGDPYPHPLAGNYDVNSPHTPPRSSHSLPERAPVSHMCGVWSVYPALLYNYRHEHAT